MKSARQITMTSSTDYPVDLTSYIRLKGFDGIFEGFSAQVPEQVDFLIHASGKRKIRSVLEIGFNAGHSSEVFLKHGCNDVVSFDLGQHPYVHFAKEYIDHNFPKRHKLILGNSEKSIPTFSEEHPGIKFDLIFIDGGHSYQTAISDLKNCKIFSHESTIVVVDDVVKNSAQQAPFNIGPTKAWNKMLQNNEVVEFGYIKSPNYPRGFVWGSYNADTTGDIKKLMRKFFGIFGKLYI